MTYKCDKCGKDTDVVLSKKGCQLCAVCVNEKLKEGRKLRI